MTQFPPPGQNPLPYNQEMVAPVSKPGSITIVAVLAIVFGALGTVCCGVVNTFGAIANRMNENKTTMPDGTVLTMDPGVAAFNAVIAVGDFVTCSILLVCGIGALGLRPWARSVGVLVSVAMIVLALVYVVGVFTYTGPRSEEMFKAFEQSVANSSTQPANVPSFGKLMSAGTMAAGVLTFILRIITPALILMLWTKANIKAWFQGATQGQQAFGGYPPR